MAFLEEKKNKIMDHDLESLENRVNKALNPAPLWRRYHDEDSDEDDEDLLLKQHPRKHAFRAHNINIEYGFFSAINTFRDLKTLNREKALKLRYILLIKERRGINHELTKGEKKLCEQYIMNLNVPWLSASSDVLYINKKFYDYADEEVKFPNVLIEGTDITNPRETKKLIEEILNKE